jgi:hypothetical protein
MLQAAVANAVDRLAADSDVSGKQIGPCVVTGLSGKGGMGILTVASNWSYSPHLERAALPRE